MVEELSKQLQHNERLTSGVVEKIGKVRDKAQNMDLTNDEWGVVRRHIPIPPGRNITRVVPGGMIERW